MGGERLGRISAIGTASAMRTVIMLVMKRMMITMICMRSVDTMDINRR